MAKDLSHIAVFSSLKCYKITITLLIINYPKTHGLRSFLTNEHAPT